MSAAQPESAPKVSISPGLHTSEYTRTLDNGVKTNLDKLNDVLGLKQEHSLTPPVQETVVKEGLSHILSLPSHELSPFDIIPQKMVPDPLVPQEKRIGNVPSIHGLNIKRRFLDMKERIKKV